MSVGYQDYARLSQQGGTLLAAVSGQIINNQVIFKGYVGSWPYINMIYQAGSSTDNVAIYQVFYSDDTFTTQVGYRVALRSVSSISWTQYANMSPWVMVYVNTGTTNPTDVVYFALYGAVGYATQLQLASLDVPIISGAVSVASLGTENVYAGHVQPGPGILSLATPSSGWTITLQRFDWATLGWTEDRQYGSNFVGTGGTYDAPMLDVPYNIEIYNGDSTSAHTFVFSWCST